ncbi:MAG: hypothetical protein KJ600_03240 [Nanoarchaeota archaeon]|nr:hypothetical protein [Nanoarchaeota archaeon]MBU1103542.1 hypothetical protein [Nanoarchaeota archaeon]
MIKNKLKRSLILSIILWAFLPIIFPRVTMTDFVGIKFHWHWTTMGYEIVSGISYYGLEGFLIPLSIVLTGILYFLLSLLLVKIWYAPEKKSHELNKKRKN